MRHDLTSVPVGDQTNTATPEVSRGELEALLSIYREVLESSISPTNDLIREAFFSGLLEMVNVVEDHFGLGI